MYGYDGVEESVNTELLCFQIDYHLNRKSHIDQMIHKLSAACYALWAIFYISNIGSPESIYFATFHSAVQHGIIWGRGRAIHLTVKMYLFGAKPTN